MTSILPVPNEDNPHTTYEDVYYNKGGNPNRDSTCNICFDDMSDMIILRHSPCGNCYHANCLEEALEADSEEEYCPRCPLCRANVALKWDPFRDGESDWGFDNESVMSVYELSDEDWDHYETVQANQPPYQSWSSDMESFVRNELSRNPDVAEDVAEEIYALQERIPPYSFMFSGEHIIFYEHRVEVIEQTHQEIIHRWNVSRGVAVVEPPPVATLRDTYYNILSLEDEDDEDGETD